MHAALLALLCSAIVTALPGDEAPEKWGGHRGGNKISHVGNNIGNGNGGGLNIDTGGGNIGCIGVGFGLGCGTTVTTVCPTTVTSVTSGYDCAGVFEGDCGGPGGFTSYCPTLTGGEISATSCCACAAAPFSCSTTGEIFTSAPYAFDCAVDFPVTTATVTTVTTTPCVTVIVTQADALLDAVEDVPGILKVV